MKCPGCGKEMEHHAGEDEGSGDVLMPYAYWVCDCGVVIRDWEEAYEAPR